MPWDSIQFAGVIEAIIFDIGNVLLKFDYTIALEQLVGRRELPPDIAAALEPLMHQIERGDIDRSTFVRRVGEILGFKGTEEQFVAAWEDIFVENHAMIEVVSRLQARYPLYLLSNVGPIHYEYVFRTYPVFGRFSGGVFSYQAKCLKPTLEIYEVAVRELGVDPQTTLFLDDLPANVEAARKAGFHAIQYDAQRHEECLEQIRSLGIDLSA